LHWKRVLLFLNFTYNRSVIEKKNVIDWTLMGVWSIGDRLVHVINRQVFDLYRLAIDYWSDWLVISGYKHKDILQPQKLEMQTIYNSISSLARTTIYRNVSSYLTDDALYTRVRALSIQGFGGWLLQVFLTIYNK
jgi:hypothetical protein